MNLIATTNEAAALGWGFGLLAVSVFVILAFARFDRWVDRTQQEEHRRNGTKPRTRKKLP